MERYNDIISELQSSLRIAKAVAIAVQSLSEKVRFQRLAKELSKALSIVTLNAHEYKDAYIAASKLIA